MALYQCSMCKEVFGEGWTTEEAEKEAERVFGVKNASQRHDMELVCEECWRELNVESNAHQLEQVRKALKYNTN